MRLTEESIRKRKRPTEGQSLDWDELVSGFGVRYTPARLDSAVFVVQWRDPATGKKPRESLRPHWPALSVVAAREMARKRLSEVVAITDSLGAQELRHAMRSWFERKTENQAWRPRYRAKVDALIRHFVEGEVSPHVKLKPTTRQAIEDLGRKPVGSVTRSDVTRVADGLKRGAADQWMAVGSSFYNDAYDRGVQRDNPFKNRFKIVGARRVRSRTLTEAEFLALWRALEGEGDPALGAFMMLAFVGCRRREATQMRWSEVDLEAATWTLPAERRKTGTHDPEPFVINLHPHVVAMLRRQPVLQGSPFVFWGRRDERPFEFHHALMQRLKALDLPAWRLHDVRRFVRSGLARLQVPQAVGELCLGHVVGGALVKVYDTYRYADEKRAAWLKWGDHLVSLIEQRS